MRPLLGQKRIALVGLSRDPRDFSASLLRELVRRGYDVVPAESGEEGLRLASQTTPDAAPPPAGSGGPDDAVVQ